MRVILILFLILFVIISSLLITTFVNKFSSSGQDNELVAEEIPEDESVSIVSDIKPDTAPDVESMEDPFLRSGMRLIIDGTDPEEVRDIMETELEYLEGRHKRGQQLFLAMAKYSPGFGMIGTLIGLISMLKAMDDPASIGPSMAVALITTFYGALMANLFFMPIAGKLKTRTEDETLMKRIVLEGIIMIQSQTNPRYIGQRLASHLPPRLRESAQQMESNRGVEVDAEASAPV